MTVPGVPGSRLCSGLLKSPATPRGETECSGRAGVLELASRVCARVCVRVSAREDTQAHTGARHVREGHSPEHSEHLEQIEETKGQNPFRTLFRAFRVQTFSRDGEGGANVQAGGRGERAPNLARAVQKIQGGGFQLAVESQLAIRPKIARVASPGGMGGGANAKARARARMLAEVAAHG